NLAVSLADRLVPVFNTPTHMPYRFVNLKTGEVKGPVSNPAEIGTYIVEWGTLSRLTGDKKYYAYAKKALTELYNRRSTINLVGESINVETGKWMSTSSHVSGGIDSYYEYLAKGWLLFRDKDLEKMWRTHKAALDKYLLDKVESGWWYGYADMNTGKRTETYYGALDAFYPAVLVLSNDLQRAQQLEQSCFAMWNLHNLEPEVIDYKKMEVVKGAEAYALRPEIIESAYYLYTRTHDMKYLEMGKKIFNDLKLYCKDSFGYAEVSNVITKNKSDREHSFFFAETLKYLYLLFDAAGPDHFVFDDYIFNTEAHPMKKQFINK
ncbi:MAG: glycoside hydrolase family 47 protein, partial [Ginsengibacter sp.]